MVTVAQLVEPRFVVPVVAGSGPVGHPISVALRNFDISRKWKIYSRILDIIFATKPENLDNFNFIHLRTDKFLIFAASSHPIFQTKIKINDLTKYKWTMNSAAKQTEDLFFNWFKSRNIPRPIISLKTNSLRLALKVVENSSMLLFTASPVYSAPDSAKL